mgnify:FL=1
MFTLSGLSSFDEIYLAYRAKFIRFALFYVSNRQAAEDIVTDSFVYYWENKSRLPEDTNVPAYILTCVKNRCLTFLRDTQLHQEILFGIQELEEWKLQLKISSLEACEPFDLFTLEMHELVRQAMNKLPAKTRRIFLMSRLGDLSHKEIAEQTGLSVKTVEFHITKAIKLLRKYLKNYTWGIFFLI